MRIVLDARKYFDFGIGTYIQNLTAHVGLLGELILLIAPADADQIGHLPSVQQRVNSARKYSLRELYSISTEANKLNADVFHAPHYTTPYGLKMPCITTIHDILHVRGKHFNILQRLYARTMIAHACNSSAAVIVDSEFTKQELLEVFKVREKLVHVVPLGIAQHFYNKYSDKAIQEFRNKYGLVKQTILYTGGLKPHKNVDVLIKACADLKHKVDFQLAFLGESISHVSRLWQLIIKNGLLNNVIEIGRLSNNELALAYQASAVVVLPSLYEGFGFSVLEAMASGTPAIGSRAASIPEVMGNGGILFDPYSSENLAFELERVLNDKNMRLDLIEKGYNNASRFSWERCVEQTFKIYMDVL